MKRAAVFLAAVTFPLSASANYAECILEKMPGIQNDSAAHAAYQVCLAEP